MYIRSAHAWRSQDGKDTPVENMARPHINNALRRSEELLAEYGMDSDMAANLIDGIDALNRELEKREEANQNYFSRLNSKFNL